MGGRGASSSGRYGGGGELSSADILSTNSFVSERHNYDISNDVLDVFKNVNEEYGYVIGDILVAKIKSKNKAMAYYDGTNIGFNEAYASTKVLNKAYADCVKSGFHPSNGNKSPAEAVASHELGHALTDAVGKKMGGLDIDRASDRIVKEAKKQTGHRGVVQMAKKISRYAAHSNAEAIAEAFSDVYCNGKKAHKESQAIVNVINSYLK
ncbi:MAG: hypothetical protein PUK72_02795 [Oscillospiraceae bacterium]|nr:hypothetical protein [Oscillospiraceae bacterium]